MDKAVEASQISGDPPSSLGSINLLMFLFYGVLGTVLPYLPVFYSNLGVPDSLIGVLGAITPAVTFLVSPFWGALADTTGLHKEIMLLTFVGSILARTALIWCSNNVLSLSFVVALSALLNAPVKPLLDSAVMSMLADKSAYGKSRLFGQVGIGMGSFLVGPMLSSNYKLMFLVQALLAAPTALLMMRFQPKRKSAVVAKNENRIDVWEAIKHTLNDVKVSIFFILVFIIGVSSGIIENFAYVRLNQLESAKGGTLGIMRLCSSLAGGPMFWISGEVIKLIGVNGVMNLSLLAYIIRFIIYATVKNAWFALPAEILRGFSFALFWSGATFYVYGISPKGLTATMLGTLNGMYGGLGQSLGSLIGGYLSKRYGISSTFKACAAIDLVIFVLYMLYQRFGESKVVTIPPPPPPPPLTEPPTSPMEAILGLIQAGKSHLRQLISSKQNSHTRKDG
jgi:MFS family permease